MNILYAGNSTGAAENGDAELPLQYTQDGRLPKPTKLSLVVKDAVRRWYLEAEKEADRGDVVSTATFLKSKYYLSKFSLAPPPPFAVKKKKKKKPRAPSFLPLPVSLFPLQKAQALLGQMLTEGYGCEADPVRGRELSEKARRRGYRMQGVYCEI